MPRRLSSKSHMGLGTCLVGCRATGRRGVRQGWSSDQCGFPRGGAGGGARGGLGVRPTGSPCSGAQVCCAGCVCWVHPCGFAGGSLGSVCGPELIRCVSAHSWKWRPCWVGAPSGSGGTEGPTSDDPVSRGPAGCRGSVGEAGLLGQEGSLWTLGFSVGLRSEAPERCCSEPHGGSSKPQHGSALPPVIWKTIGLRAGTCGL